MSKITGRIHAEAIFAAAIDAVRPVPRVQQALQETNLRAAIERARRIIVVGGGKAGAGMVQALETTLEDHLDRLEGIVNVPDTMWQPTLKIRLRKARPVGCNEPTAEAYVGTECMLDLVACAEGSDLVLVLLSGGGSALLPAPDGDITLADKIAITKQLSAAGADIRELNCVRKHISRIKGGRLAEAARHASAVWSLIISDVVGNPLDVIASGPTSSDPTTYDEALDIVTKYRLVDTMPRSVLEHLARGAAGTIPETPKSLPSNVCNRIIATNADALAAAKDEARSLGYSVIVLGDSFVGEARDVAKLMASYLPNRESRRRRQCFLLGGETTVTLGENSGKGGRNQEFALALGCQLKTNGLRGVTVLCGATDGEDGPTDAAGAILDSEIWNQFTTLGLDPHIWLRHHDTYKLFELVGALIKTGLTGTNVMDIAIAIVGDV